MIWLEFALSAILLVVAAIKLAESADAISLRTRLGGMFVGTLLLAGATSLPELLTALASISQQVPELAAGSIFGSSMFNMLLLAVLDLMHPRTRILRTVAVNHALSAGIAVLLTSLAVFFLVADVGVQIGWVGLDSVVLVGTYLLGMVLIFSKNRSLVPLEQTSPESADQVMGLAPSVIGFVGATIVLVLVTPWLVSSSVGISEITGLSTGLIGAVLVAIVTSLPEVVTSVAATRMGAHDLAVGNLFGSNIFNIFALASVDLFYFQGRFLAIVDPALILAGMAGLVLTSLGLVTTVAEIERRFFLVELDALLIILGYLGTMLLLFNRGLVG